MSFPLSFIMVLNKDDGLQGGTPETFTNEPSQLCVGALGCTGSSAVAEQDVCGSDGL